MSFPASTKMEKMYRNDIDDVAAFFDTEHPDSYQIFNMSNRDIQVEKFNHMVEAFSWEDHHSPALRLLFESCDKMFKFLNDNN